MSNKAKSTTLFTEETTQITRRKQFTVHKPDKETFHQPSQTVPDATLSISQMLARVQQGLPINSGQQPVFLGEKFYPNWQALDLIDRDRLVKETKLQVAEKKLAYQKAQKAHDEKKVAAALKKIEREKQFDAWQASQKQTPAVQP